MAPSNTKNEHEQGYADIEKISQIPKDEFKRQLEAWMQAQQPKLQSQLIENFTKTGLGRQITSTLQNRQGIVLSPLTLVLNTLVSEFLHSQDYHFTLCVFSTEVVFPHTLPDYSKENFSFTEKDMNEIFEAMGLLKLNNVANQICGSYYQKSQDKGNKSLLYAVIKVLIENLKNIKEEKINKNIQVPTSSISMGTVNGHQPGPKKPPRHNKVEISSESGSEVPININNLKILNKTIEKLSKSVKNMARHYMNMETSRLNNKSHHHHTSKIELDREEKHYYNLMRHIENISAKLDKCVVNFESLEHKLHMEKNGLDGFEKMRFRDWLQMMSNTKNGKKYIDKFQRSIQRYWEAEKEKLKKYYQEKLSFEKKALKFKYREELREQIEAKLGAHKEATEINKDTIKEILENKMHKIESRDQHLGKKLEKLEEIVHDYKDEEQKKKDEIKKMALKLAETLKSVEKTVQKVPESIKFLEKRSLEPNIENEVENIIKSAKSRIKTLEQEGEALEKSYMNYLERQKDKKTSIETDRIRIWQDYQLERRALQSHPVNIPRTSTPFDLQISQSTEKALNYDDMVTELNSADVRGRGEVNVVNPFKTFDTATYLQKAHEKHLLEGPKIERLEAYRRLDREVENIKRKVYMDQSFKSGVSNMYLNPGGRSIFGPSRFMDVEKIVVKEQEIQTEIEPKPVTKEVKWHGILKQNEPQSTVPMNSDHVNVPSIPAISIQKSDDNKIDDKPSNLPQKSTLNPPASEINPSSDRSSPLKSDLDLGDVTLDIELSKTTKSSSGNSSNEKPIPDVGAKSPTEKGLHDASEKETWHQQLFLQIPSNVRKQDTDETVYRSLLMTVNEKTPENNPKIDENKCNIEAQDEIFDKTVETVKDVSMKSIDNESPDQKSSTFESEIERMSKKAHELQEKLKNDLKNLMDEPMPSTSNNGFLENFNKISIPSETPSESKESNQNDELNVKFDEKHPVTLSNSESSSEKYKISTGKRTSSETSDEFWK